MVAIALKYEEAMIRQKTFARLIEEIRLLDFGADLQDEFDVDMVVGLEFVFDDKGDGNTKCCAVTRIQEVDAM